MQLLMTLQTNKQKSHFIITGVSSGIKKLSQVVSRTQRVMKVGLTLAMNDNPV